MADATGKVPDQDTPADEADEYTRMREALLELVTEFAEDHDLPFGALSPLLVDLAVSSRMLDYVMETEKPSSSGLKLDLDRMRRDVEDFLRDCKRHAEEFVADAKEQLREMADEDTEAEDEDPAVRS
jgi:hypothetical protein